jgi:hypothetical protein
LIPRTRNTIARLLLDGERLTKYTAAHRANAYHRTTQRILGDMHQRGLVRIVDWERSKGAPLPVYATFGKQPPRPARMTPCEARAAQRRDPERRQLEASRKRLYRAMQRPVVELNLSMLFKQL